MKRLRAGVCVALLLVGAAPASADETSVGITVNATGGSHVESMQASSIPLLPLPAIEIDHIHQQFRLHLEGVPPLGPAPLGESSPYSESLAPRVSYLNGELLYRSTIEPIEIGVGETVLNQETVDQVPTFFSQSSWIHYSRIAGMRLAARIRLYGDARHRVDAWLAVNPAMHGLEDGRYAEDASLFDGSLRWTLPRSRYDIVYGVRYLNYTAAYSATQALGDRNHLFMPFIGIDWHGAQRVEHIATGDGHVPVTARAPKDTVIGVSFLGSNGNRAYTGGYSQTPLNFALIPELRAAHSFGRYEIAAEGIVPNSNPNPFGTSQSKWSYVSGGATTLIGRSGVALGLGETVTNILPLGLPPDVHSATRSEALDLLAHARFTSSPAADWGISVKADPYVHVTTNFSNVYNGVTHAGSSTQHGARVDVSLDRYVYLRQYVLNYGVRYINQTTNYNGMTLTRSMSLMPFAGLDLRF